MIITPIHIPCNEFKLIERLRHIVNADPRLQMAVFHRPGNNEFDPWYIGCGRIGDPIAYKLLARESVLANEIIEIGRSIEGSIEK